MAIPETVSLVPSLAKEYLPQAWLDARLIVLNSKIEGQGIFANNPIKEGETVILWGGTIMTTEDIRMGRHRPRSHAEIGEGLFIAGEIDDPEEDPDENLNHSCDPNLWLADEVTLQAKRYIAKGEEITLDYSTFCSMPDWKMQCNCKSQNCRGLVTGNDWALPQLQERYKGHFSPYLNKRI